MATKKIVQPPKGLAPRTTQVVPVDLLQFDPENPRLPSSVDGTKEAEVLKWLLEDGTLPELMAAIGQQGYFEGEPLLVVKSTRGKGFVVVEGNRRLGAVKLLRKPSIAPVRSKTVQSISQEAAYKPDEVPVLEFKKRDDILFYLGYRHITGIKSWDPIAKARYLHQLSTKMGGKNSREKFQSLARSIGSQWDYVAQLLTGLAIYKTLEANNFFKVKDLDESTIDFSVLTTALSYENIVTAFLGLDSAANPDIRKLNLDNLQKLVRWMFEEDVRGQTKLGESRNLKALNRIVVNPNALKAFEAGYLISEADMLTDAPREIFQTSIRESRKNLEIARNHLHLVEKPDRSDADVLDDIGKLLKLLQDWARAKLANGSQQG